MDIITRPQAIEAGLSRYFTGKPCKRGHIEERTVDKCWCVGCRREDAYARASIPEVRAKNVARLKARRDANPDENRRNVAKWKRENRAKVIEQKARRRGLDSKSWDALDDFDRFVWQEAGRIRDDRIKATGFGWDIDHMIPLSAGGDNKFYNIQVIPRSMNLSKGAKMIYTKPMEWIGSLPGA